LRAHDSIQDGEAHRRPLVLHVPYTFFPDQSGGTETYVASLASALRDKNVESEIAAPAAQEAAYEYQGTTVYRFMRARSGGLEQAYGAPDETAVQSFTSLLQRVRPRIVHLHAHTAAVSYRLADAAIAAGAKVFFTYHTPTVTCLRGDMLHLGKEPCDGVLDEHRCTTCVLRKHGLLQPAAALLSHMPVRLAQTVNRTGCSGGAFTALRMRKLVADAHGRMRLLMDKADCIIAVCEWVMNLLVANAVPRSKLVLCRQGVDDRNPESHVKAATGVRDESRPLRLAYFGRLEHTKGVDILIQAMKQIVGANVYLDIFGIAQPNTADYVASLKRSAVSGVTFHEPLPPSVARKAMADYDFVVVPSRWMETGPLVIYEAFAAGTPVLTSDLGGSGELVTHDLNGLLIRKNDSGSWAECILSVAHDHGLAARLRAGIRMPRSMSTVAAEMVQHYQRVLAVA
jgi:glycosyltransferase involved in cell wall biosynthesis